MMETSLLSIPGKNSYKFHELTAVTGVKPYVLRFWETEFTEISPLVDEFGHKVYSQKDLRIIEKVKNLLFEEKLSIPQAKLRLSEVVEEEVPSLRAESFEPQRSYPMAMESAVQRNPLQFLSDVKVQLRAGLEKVDQIKKRQGWGLSQH